MAKTKVKRPRHWLNDTPEYKSWKNIRKRCLDPRSENTGAYQGRGIKMCEGIKTNVRHFANTVGKRPEGTEIDRIDNNGHYSCGDCPQCKKQGWPMNMRWTTHKENCRNKRNNRFITFRGKTQTIAAWAEETGISGMVIHRRLRAGWSLKKALTTAPDGIGNQPTAIPKTLYKKIAELYASGLSLAVVGKQVGFTHSAIQRCLVRQGVSIRTLSEQKQLMTPHNAHFITFQGHSKTLTQWAKDTGLPYSTIIARFGRGWSVEKTLTTPYKQC